MSAHCNVGQLDRYGVKQNDDVPQIRKADLENHNKDGGLWVVIHGRVYDVHEFKTQAPCGQDTLVQCAGKETHLPHNLADLSHALKGCN